MKTLNNYISEHMFSGKKVTIKDQNGTTPTDVNNMPIKYKNCTIKIDNNEDKNWNKRSDDEKIKMCSFIKTKIIDFVDGYDYSYYGGNFATFKVIKQSIKDGKNAVIGWLQFGNNGTFMMFDDWSLKIKYYSDEVNKIVDFLKHNNKYV